MVTRVVCFTAGFLSGDVTCLSELSLVLSQHRMICKQCYILVRLNMHTVLYFSVIRKIDTHSINNSFIETECSVVVGNLETLKYIAP